MIAFFKKLFESDVPRIEAALQDMAESMNPFKHRHVLHRMNYGDCCDQKLECLICGETIEEEDK